ncbi:MAG: hypothetical protein NZM29_06125 [Nitrospira sp.]|nr:hypothetical protein [Nitrospira sp.]
MSGKLDLLATDSKALSDLKPVGGPAEINSSPGIIDHVYSYNRQQPLALGQHQTRSLAVFLRSYLASVSISGENHSTQMALQRLEMRHSHDFQRPWMWHGPDS